MKLKRFSRISAFLPLVVSIIWLQFLPAQIPLHYDVAGNIDRWGSKWEQLLVPGIVFLMGSVFLLAEWSERQKAAKDETLIPKAVANIKVIRIVMLCFYLMFTCVVAVTLYGAGQAAAGNSEKMSIDVNRVVAIFMGLALIVTGNYMPKSRPNSFVGFRCSWSMYNDVTWQKSNRFAGMAVMIAGIVIVVCGVLLPLAWVMKSFLAVLGASIVVSLVYAAKVYHEEMAKE